MLFHHRRRGDLKCIKLDVVNISINAFDNRNIDMRFFLLLFILQVFGDAQGTVKHSWKQEIAA